MLARHVAPGIHCPVTGNLGGRAPLKLPQCVPTSPWPCRCACTAGSESQMAIYVLHAALPASQPALPIMNFLCGISLRPQKLVSALQFGWGGCFGGEGESWKGLCPVVGS